MIHVTHECMLGNVSQDVVSGVLQRGVVRCSLLKFIAERRSLAYKTVMS